MLSGWIPAGISETVMNAWSGKILLINPLPFTAGENTTNTLFAGLVYLVLAAFLDTHLPRGNGHEGVS